MNVLTNFWSRLKSQSHWLRETRRTPLPMDPQGFFLTLRIDLQKSVDSGRPRLFFCSSIMVNTVNWRLRLDLSATEFIIRLIWICIDKIACIVQMRALLIRILFPKNGWKSSHLAMKFRMKIKPMTIFIKQKLGKRMVQIGDSRKKRIYEIDFDMSFMKSLQWMILIVSN